MKHVIVVAICPICAELQLCKADVQLVICNGKLQAFPFSGVCLKGHILSTEQIRCVWEIAVGGNHLPPPPNKC